LALGDVFRHPDEILRRAVGAEHQNLNRVQLAKTAMRGLDRLLGKLHHRPACRTARSFATKKLACSAGKKA
jgi:hypothetical protein